MASSPGAWGAELSATVDTNNLFDTSGNQFNLTIADTGIEVAQEIYPGANLTKGTPQYLPTLLAASQFVDPALDHRTNGPCCRPGDGGVRSGALRTSRTPPDGAPTAAAGAAGADPAAAPLRRHDGIRRPECVPTPPIEPIPLGDQSQKTGIYALPKADIFNILCLPYDPAITYDPDDDGVNLDAAVTFCVPTRHADRRPATSWSRCDATSRPLQSPPLEFPTIAANHR